ncbi:conserved protein of unknown function [Shewanella benthica]|uniref:Uncharacterized protein n=2 Tax=Shewanella benthica TaxID=43661 RepID=A0A330M237_9GAMM|nr:hypothetical protein KT99_00630 [Shewanella benthica KT99]SQH76088.1 conserved protein of unknown function [Shewanella benthica]
MTFDVRVRYREVILFEREAELAVKHGRCLKPQSPQGCACGTS